MARYYAEVTGSRGTTVSKTDTKNIKGHVRGWDVGVYVEITPDFNTGKDRVRVFRTGGSNRPDFIELLADFTQDETKR